MRARCALVGMAALLLTAADRADAQWAWTTRTIQDVGAIRTVAFGKGAFVAGTSNGSILQSFNGVDWSLVARPTTTQPISAIAYAEGRFVAAAGAVEGVSARLFYSGSGVIWNAARKSGGGAFRPKATVAAIAHNRGRFLALGSNTQNVAFSENGSRWQFLLGGAKPAHFAGSVTGLIAQRGKFLMASTLAAATIQRSTDGTNWETVFTDARTGPARDIAAKRGSTRVVCIGENGLCLVSTNSGADWKAFNLGGIDFLALDATSTEFVAITNRRVYSSGQGTQWTERHRTSNTNRTLRDITTGNGLVVAVGGSGSNNGLVAVSNQTPVAPAP